MKKKIYLIILLSLVIILLSCSKHEVDIDTYNTTNWKVSKEVFDNNYYEKINNYIMNKITDFGPIDVYEHYEEDNKHHAELISKKFSFKIDYIYYSEVKLVFNLSYYYFLDYKEDINEDNIKDIDSLITDFINKLLYFPDKSSNIIDDMVLSNKKTEIFYDNLIGNLGLMLIPMNKLRYFNVNFKTIFKDSDLVLSRIKN